MNKLAKLLKRLFTKQYTIDSVLENLSKPLAQLKKLEQQHKEIVDDQEKKIAKLQADNVVKTKAANRAAQVHQNISSLLAVDAE